MQTKRVASGGSAGDVDRSSAGSSRARGRRARRVAATCATAAALVAVALPGYAHHSFAMYDRTRTEALTGKLTRFIPGANHAQILFELVDEHGETVHDENGRPVVWGFETQPSARIARDGVTVASFPPGTILSVTVNPLRDGRTFGVLAGPIVKCGVTLPEGGCTEETGEVFIIGGN